MRGSTRLLGYWIDGLHSRVVHVATQVTAILLVCAVMRTGIVEELMTVAWLEEVFDSVAFCSYTC